MVFKELEAEKNIYPETNQHIAIKSLAGLSVSKTFFFLRSYKISLIINFYLLFMR